MKPEATVAAEFRITPSTVRKIVLKKEEWMRLVRLGHGSSYQFHPPRQNQELYTQGSRMIAVLRDALVGVTKSMMFQYFGTFDHFIQLTENGKEKFWQRFCRFANVCRRRVNGCTQLVPTDADERVRNFLEMMTLMNVDRRGYSVILTGDETGVVWEPVSSVTIELRGTRRVRVRTAGTERQMTTAFFAARSVRGTGGVWDHTMLPPHLIWQAQSSTGPISREINAAAVKYRCTATTTASGWTNGDSFMAWLQRELLDHARYPPRQTLLVIDLYAAHRTHEILSYLREREVDFLFIPSGCTSLIQLMDVAVNRAFKHHYRDKFSTWRASQNGFRRPTCQKITRFVTEALQSFPAVEAYGVEFERKLSSYLLRGAETICSNNLYPNGYNLYVVVPMWLAQRLQKLLWRQKSSPMLFSSFLSVRK